MDLNRRSFLKVAGAGAAAAMAAAGATAALADAPAPAAGFVPGTYTGTGKGISSDVTVTVTVDETSVTDVTVDASGETANIGAAAADELASQLLAAGSSEIDGVSGATITSDAAASAMDAALAAASAGDQAAADEHAAAAAEASLDTDWKTAPAEVTDFVAEYDTEVVVVGHGYAGITATRELAEQGHAVTLIEALAEDSWQALGNEFACINGDAVINYGADHIDPVEFYNNFMKITSNMPNPALVMKFAQNSAENSNWYLDRLTADDLATMTSNFLPKTEHQLAELNGIKFWASVCSFYNQECGQTKIQTYNREAAIENGAQVMFGTAGYYVIMNDGKVAGLVAKNDEGYIKFNCKAVVVATGGFGGNIAMMNDLIPDMYNALVEGESLSCMSGRDGSGVKMAYWAGAHLETTPIPGMNMKGLSVPGKMSVLPQAVWVDENGKRYCNEFWPTAEQRGYQNIFQTRKTKFAICDDNFTEYRQYTLPQHAGFDATESNVQALRDSLDEAYAKFNGTWVEPEKQEQGPMGGPMTAAEFIADDTLEGLADQLGFEGAAKEAFLAQIEEYNQYCEDGADQQFGRDAQVLFPVKQAPFYAVKFEPQLGETMVTMGGILTDGEQNAVDKNYEPIPGLYVSGNDCGRRFGIEYVTPIPGCSLGMAITLGRECGKSVCKFLDAQA